MGEAGIVGALIALVAALATGVLGLLARELPKVAAHLGRISGKLSRLLERRGIADSDPPPVPGSSEDDTKPSPLRQRAKRLSRYRLPTVHDEDDK